LGTYNTLSNIKYTQLTTTAFTQTDRLRLLAGKIANLNWILDQKYKGGTTDRDLEPLRNKINELLGKYQQGREYYNCSHQEFVDDDDDGDLWANFDFCRPEYCAK